VKKKFGANLQRCIELSTQKLSLSSQKYGFGIRDPGVKKASDPGSGSTTLWLSQEDGWLSREMGGYAGEMAH